MDLYVLIKGIKDELTADLKAARSEIADLATRVLRLENGALRVEKLEGAVAKLTDEIHRVLERLIEAKDDALQNTRQDLVTVQRQGDMEARLARRERMVGHAKVGAKWTAIATVGAIVLKIVEWWVTDKATGLF